MMSASIDYDVIVAGCGPVGAVAANLLGHHGLSTLVLERDRDPYTLPRAIHLDHEVMRILQSAGLAEQILPCLTIPASTVHIGADGAVIRQLRTTSFAAHIGWASDYFFYQPELESRLRSGLLARPQVEVRFEHRVDSVEQRPDGVTVRATAAGKSHEFHGKYLLACDGASSTVRKQLGVALDDLGFDEPWIVIDARVRGPITFPVFAGVPAGADLQRTLVMIGDPRRPLTVIPGAGDHRRWECMLLPGETEEMVQKPETLAQILAPWTRQAQCEVIRVAVYRFHGLLAQQWRVGRVFLVGDSAHQSPPFYGQGLCHGIRDAANLAWKLKLALDGLAGPGLLDTYETERKPQVRKVIEASIRTGRYICTLDPAAARERDRTMREVAMQTAPGYVDIIPPLARGALHFGADSRGVGSRFIQPRVSDGRGAESLLDDITGGGFVMLVRGLGRWRELPAEHLEFWNSIGGRLFHVVADAASLPGMSPRLLDITGELGKWLDRHGGQGVILRPDAYVFSVLRTDADIAPALAMLQAALARER